MKKHVKNFLVLTTLAAGAIHLTNRFIDMTASMKNLLATDQGSFYKWKNGDIYYSKYGEGSPVLFIHDLNPASSSYEWNKMVRKLQKDHTVYTLDLLGCGRSAKPYLTYTNYLYVQLLTDFIKDVVKEKVVVIATGSSCSFTLMASHMEKDLFQDIICVNPESLTASNEIPDKVSQLRKWMLECPILGTFIYNIEMSRKNIDAAFRIQYFNRPQLISSALEDFYFESSHRDRSHGKYLQASIYGNYTKISMTHALSKIEVPVHLIGSRNYRNSVEIVDSYTRYNANFETAYLSGCKLLPQLEIPDKLCQVIEAFLEN